MEIVNCTPHAVTLVTTEGQVTLPPSGHLPRVEATRETMGTVEVNGLTVPVTVVAFGSLAGLPPRQDETLYLVSALTAQAAKALGRTDVVIVDDTVRDEAGRIVGCRALARP